MKRTPKKKNGIALVIVVGLLFVITVLAIGFIVTARVERMVSRAHIDAVRARQTVQVAIAEAARTLDLQAQSGTTKFFYPPSTNLYSYASGALAVAARETTLLNQAILNSGYIPNPDGLASARATQALRFIRWMQVTNINAAITTTNRLRYAWVAVDCSGLADANATTNLGLAPIGVNVNNIINQTYGAGPSRVGRVESVADLNSLPNNLRSPFLFSYSRSVGGGGTSASMLGNVPIWIGGTAGEIKGKEADILTALAAAGFSAPHASALFNNLVDYVDEDFVPGGTAVADANGTHCKGIGTEAVPMINEVSFTSKIPAGSNQLVVNFDVELWHPFVGTNAAPLPALDLVVDMELVGGVFNGNRRFTQTVNLPGAWTFDQYHPASFNWTATGGTTNEPAPTALKIHKIGVQIRGGGSYVDFASATTDIPWNGNFAMNPTAGDVVASFQARDPRINWDLSPAANHYVKSTTPTRDDRNTGVTGEAGNDIAMYVRNGSLTSVGELGYLLFTATPWSTVDLYNASHAKVFDHFVTHQGIKRGALNPSTPYTNVLACAFANKRLNQYPGDPAGTLISDAQALQLAAAIINECPIEPGPGYANPSEVVALAGAGIKTQVAAIAGGTPTATQNESVLRQGMPELTVRQNMFAIVVLAQTLAPATANTAPTPIAEQVAVAYLWRDPYKDDSVGAPFFPRIIQFLRWLDE